jgi:hypothetical protein
MKITAIITVMIFLMMQVQAYTPVVFMNGGSYKCLDSPDKCAEEGKFYKQYTNSNPVKGNGLTPVFIMFGICILAMMAIVVKGRNKGWNINA